MGYLLENGDSLRIIRDIHCNTLDYRHSHNHTSLLMSAPQSIFQYKKYWAKRFGTAPFLPMSKEEMEKLGWDQCDIILVTGDAYVDHPSFGMAIVGRL